MSSRGLSLKDLDELCGPLAVVSHLTALKPQLVMRTRMQQATEVVVGLRFAVGRVSELLLATRYQSQYWAMMLSVLRSPVHSP